MAPSAERRAPSAERRAPSAERRAHSPWVPDFLRTAGHATRGSSASVRICLALTAFALAFAAAPQYAHAQTEVAADWTLIPSGLGAGDQFRLLVVTSTTRDATSSNIGDYDTHVQTAVASGHTAIRSYSSQFKVLGSTASDDAREHTGTRYTGDTTSSTTDDSNLGVPIYYLDGAKVADDYRDLYDGSWDSNVSRNESGDSDPGLDQVWTGAATDGTVGEFTIGANTYDMPLGGSSVGNRTSYGCPLGSGTELNCGGTGNTATNALHLYGLSPVFQVAGAANNAPQFTTTALSAAENQTTAGTVVATDTDTDDSITGYALTGGVDQALFEINSSSGLLTFKTAPDHENPADAASTTPMNAAGNNEYIVQVTATSGTGGRVKTTAQTITVTVTDVTERANFSVASLSATTEENAEWVSAAPTTSGDAPIGDLTWTKDVVSADEDRFTLEGATGVLTLPAQDYENPGDAGVHNGATYDNEYEIVVIATDEDGNTAEWEVAVEVTDVVETRTFTVTGVPASVNVAENAEWENALAITGDLPVGGAGREGWTFEGADALEFKNLTSPSRVQFRPHDYENPEDANGDNVYEVTLKASDDDGNSATHALRVTVTDVTAVHDGAYCAGSIWCGTLLAGAGTQAADGVGYRRDGAYMLGTLSDDDFDFGVSRTVNALFETATGLTLVLDPSPGEFAGAGLTLHVGNRQLPFADARWVGPLTSYAWSNANVTWSDGDEEAVKLTRAANNAATGTPVITKGDGTALDAAPQAGGTLAVDIADIADTDGLPNKDGDSALGEAEDFDYQWLRVDGGTETEVGTAATYTVGAGDVGKTLKVKVSFTDGLLWDETVTSAETATVAAADTNTAPSFVGNAQFSVAENQTTVGTVAATDPDTQDDITGYAITGGVDQALFEIDSSSGLLTFKTAPDYENPADVASTNPANDAGNNEYIVEVTATSGTGDRARTYAETFIVTVTDLDPETSTPTMSVGAALGTTITEGNPLYFAFDVNPKPTASTKYTVTYSVAETGDMVAPADEGTGKTWSFIWHVGHSCYVESFTDTIGACADGWNQDGFSTVDDSMEEDDSVVTVTLTAVAAVDSTNSAVTAPALGSPLMITVENNTTPAIRIADAAASESAGTIDFSVTLAPAHDRDATVEWRTSELDATATAGTHYTAANGTLTFKAGETHKTASVQIADDTVSNEPRTFTMQLANPTGGVTLVTDSEGHTGRATGTILDDDGSGGGTGSQNIQLWIEDGAAIEGDSDGVMQFEVRLSETYPWREITVDYTTSPGTATAGEDYTHTSGTLTFPAHEGCCDPIEVPILGDDVDEDKKETFTVTLSNPQGAELTGTTAIGTIFDEDVDDTGIELHIDVWANHLKDDGTVRFEGGKFMVQFIFQHPERPFTGIAMTGFDATDVTTTGNANFRFIPPAGTGVQGQFANMEVTPNDVNSFDVTISVAAKAALGTDTTGQGLGDYSSTGNTAASLRVQHGQQVPVSLSARAGIDVVITAPGSKKQGRIVRDADGGFDVDIAFVDPTQPVVGIPVTDFTPGDVEVTGGRAAGRFSEENYQGAAYRLRIIPDRGADEVTVTVPTGVAEAKDDASNVNAESSETFELARAEALTARFDGLPATHDGGSFGFRIAFSEDIDAEADEMRDDALEVSGGAVSEAARADGRNDLWRFTVEASGGGDIEIELPGGRECAEAGAVCTADGRQLSAGLLGLVAGPPPLTAAFTSVPEEHDGTSAFDFRVEFSEDIGNSYVTLRDEVFTVTGGGVTGAHRVEGRNDLWEITVRPDSREEITVTLPGDRACGTTGAVCTGGDHPRPLSNSPSATVAGPPLEPLTASFDDVPAEHPGERFTFGLTLSEEPHGLSYTTLRDHAFAVGGGTVYSASRRQQGTNRLWTIHIDPSGRGAVTVRLPETGDCNASGAICTEDGRPLSHALSATVIGPAGLSVADAEAEENVDETIDFTVTLDRAASGTVTVNYATADGSATAGADYTAASGTLTFQAGERTKTVAVTLLDDTHDEGEETFTLTLSNASGAVIVDGEATGTIENHDPMPRALLARFGRAAAQHVVEHVEERIAAPREPGFQGRFAGQELRRGMERDMAAGFLGQLWGAGGANVGGTGVHDPLSGMPGAGAAPLGTPGLGGGAPMGMAGPMGGGMGPGALGGGMGPDSMSAGAGPGAMGGGVGSGAMDAGAGPLGGLNRRRLFRMGFGGGDVLTGSAFELNRETRHGGVLSFWSRGAQSSFHGREGALALNGQVRTTMVGADYAKDRLVAGLSLARSQSLGEYRAETAGQVQSAVTGLYPWLGYQLTDRVSVWGVTGYGSGGLLLTPGSGAALQSDLSMAMTAGGTRGDLVAGGAGGFVLAFKADALWVGTSIDGTDGPEGRLKATGAAVTRFRTGLEGSRDYTLGSVLSLKPLVEVGLRHDGGDAETGAGMDVGGGVTVSAPAAGLSVDLRVRMLLVHQAEGFSDRGLSMTLSYNPTPSTPLGFAARVAPSWGGQAMGGAEALWGRETMAGMANGGVAAGNRLDGEVGYGLPLGSRFVGTPRVGFGTSEYGRDYRLGYGMTLLEQGALGFEVGVDAQRRESPGIDGADNGFMGRATVRW